VAEAIAQENELASPSGVLLTAETEVVDRQPGEHYRAKKVPNSQSNTNAAPVRESRQVYESEKSHRYRPEERKNHPREEVLSVR
jgi:hypothetical protein